MNTQLHVENNPLSEKITHTHKLLLWVKQSIFSGTKCVRLTRITQKTCTSVRSMCVCGKVYVSDRIFIFISLPLEKRKKNVKRRRERTSQSAHIQRKANLDMDFNFGSTDPNSTLGTELMAEMRRKSNIGINERPSTFSVCLSFDRRGINHWNFYYAIWCLNGMNLIRTFILDASCSSIYLFELHFSNHLPFDSFIHSLIQCFPFLALVCDRLTPSFSRLPFCLW